MNANAIQPGLEYAYTLYPSRGKSVGHYNGCMRVRVLHVYKGLEKEFYHRNVTLVECVRLDEDGNVDDRYHLITTPARHIVASWNEYITEVGLRQKELEEERERRRKAREEREAEHQRIVTARREKETELRQFVAERLDIPMSFIHLRYDSIAISRNHIERRVLEQNQSKAAESDSDQKPASTSEVTLEFREN